MNIDRLRGIIAEKYRTQAAFASVMGWTNNKMSHMMTGKYKPDVDEVGKISKLLALTEQQYIEIFYSPILSTNGDEKTA